MAISMAPVVSLSLIAGNKFSIDKRSHLTLSMAPARPSSLLHISFLGLPSAPFSFPSSSFSDDVEHRQKRYSSTRLKVHSAKLTSEELV